MVQSITAFINDLEVQYADRTAFQWVDEDGQLCSKTFREYVSDIRRFADCLKTAFPDCAGKHIGVLAQKSYDNIVCNWGVLYAGAVLVLLNTRESAKTLQEQIAFSDCEIIIAEKAFGEENGPLMGFSGKVHPLDAYHTHNSQPSLSMYGAPEDPLVFMFTSGTTSASKCVIISRKNIFAAFAYMEEIHDAVLESVDKPVLSAFHMLPLYHVAGLVSLLGWNAHGEIINLNLNMKYLLRDQAQMPSDYTVVIPAVLDMWNKLVSIGKADRLGGLSVIIACGAVIDPNVIDNMGKHGFTLLNSYGLTETTSFGIYSQSSKTGKYSSIGHPGIGTEAKLDNGEICLKGDLVMTGYYKNEELTGEVLVDGWFHTGDLGYMDEDGDIYITGRKKNLIILSTGENVSPEELETLVSGNENVKEIVVKEKDNKICAEIFCEPDKQEEIRAYVTEVNRTLALYKRISLVLFRAEPFPRTASGKIKRI